MSERRILREEICVKQITHTHTHTHTNTHLNRRCIVCACSISHRIVTFASLMTLSSLYVFSKTYSPTTTPSIRRWERSPKRVSILPQYFWKFSLTVDTEGEREKRMRECEKIEKIERNRRRELSVCRSIKEAKQNKTNHLYKISAQTPIHNTLTLNGISDSGAGGGEGAPID